MKVYTVGNQLSNKCNEAFDWRLMLENVQRVTLLLDFINGFINEMLQCFSFKTFLTLSIHFNYVSLNVLIISKNNNLL